MHPVQPTVAAVFHRLREFAWRVIGVKMIEWYPHCLHFENGRRAVLQLDCHCWVRLVWQLWQTENQQIGVEFDVVVVVVVVVSSVARIEVAAAAVVVAAVAARFAVAPFVVAARIGVVAAAVAWVAVVK